MLDQGEDSEESIDDEQEGGQWITEDNLYSHIAGNDLKKLGQSEPTDEHSDQNHSELVEKDDGKPKSVQFITSDFAMQNVII